MLDYLTNSNGSCIGCRRSEAEPEPRCEPAFHGWNEVGKGQCLVCQANLYGCDIFNFWIYKLTQAAKKP